MSLLEAISCWVVFCAIGLILIQLVKIKRISFLRFETVFLPGFVVANVISHLLSQPGDQLVPTIGPELPDLPIFVGFPLSFYRIGPWESQFYFLAFAANILLVVVLGYLVKNPLQLSGWLRIK